MKSIITVYPQIIKFDLKIPFGSKVKLSPDEEKITPRWGLSSYTTEVFTKISALWAFHTNQSPVINFTTLEKLNYIKL